MNKKIKLSISIILLFVLTIFIKINANENKMITIDIDSPYANMLKLARNIIEEQREYVYIDKNILVNPVVYELKLYSEKLDSEKANSYFIEKHIREEYIKSIFEENGLFVLEKEFEEYKKEYCTGIMKCKGDRIALINGYNSFDEYVNSKEFKKDSLFIIRYEKLKKMNPSDLVIKYEKANFISSDIESIIEENTKSLYAKYKNKNRY